MARRRAQYAAALLGGILAHTTRQPLILGYVIGGIVIGPFTPGPTVFRGLNRY